MTTRQTAEALLFTFDAEMSTILNKPTRRRIDATYCPICRSWVEVRLRPVRLHCTGCGAEAKP